MAKVLKMEWALLLGLATLALFKGPGATWLADPSNALLYWGASAALLSVVMLAVFCVVRHSDALAIKLGDPYGTLILTLAVILLEVAMISSVMLTGEPTPTMARDTMFAVVMVVLNGLLGIALILGGLKFHTQTFNLDGARSYLAGIVPLALICLVLPNFTTGGIAGGLSLPMSILVVALAAILYGVFLWVQTRSHTHFFVDADHEDEEEHHGFLGPNAFHTVMLVAYLVVVILLAKVLANPIDHIVSGLGAPLALSGLIVAIIILAPEAVGAVKAALSNQLQRAINLFLGSVLASIALTVPAVLVIAYLTDQSLILGLAPAEMVLLGLTLLLCQVSFSGKTNVLTGTAHLALFLVYLVMMFE
ncbi:calcium:proton antiporter [Ferrimonas balearica]|uniref:calcium:proton antiporter n=1 Tax=Ferrimonas balearica TaxID=44012 RepID=UPI001C9A00F4|nr:calcium:proton antiporter [Ferrimonas balearica]MBY5991815.1 calcium:proton antiporter [Ferrimonas balearica]